SNLRQQRNNLADHLVRCRDRGLQTRGIDTGLVAFVINDHERRLGEKSRRGGFQLLLEAAKYRGVLLHYRDMALRTRERESAAWRVIAVVFFNPTTIQMTIQLGPLVPPATVATFYKIGIQSRLRLIPQAIGETGKNHEELVWRISSFRDNGRHVAGLAAL